ncbi:hypothetical protein ACIOJE_27285 [Kitasatospora sp. NPDC087861]|uniref:hypothetical protein n=1 Tax=Kitasatospora sp. NPDC087861 TaxID=3364070 RepID=UPI00381B2601
MSKPNWMASHLGAEHSPDPLAQLLELGRWLDDPARRFAWRTARKACEAAVTDADRAHDDAQRPSRCTPAARIADLHEQLDLAQGRAGLLALVEELAERTRLRATTTVLWPSPFKGAFDPQTLRLLATRISTGTQQLLTELEADFVYPDEVHRNAEAALAMLTSRRLAAEATGEPAVLSGWAEAIEFALAVVQTASTRA